MWVRVGHRWEMALARPRPACLLDSDAQRTCSGTSGGWTNQVLLSRRPDEVGTRVLPIFEPFGLSSRSCCSTGRLMRSLSPLVGVVADLRLPPFFTVRTQCTAATSVRVGWGRGQGQGSGVDARDLPRLPGPGLSLQ